MAAFTGSPFSTEQYDKEITAPIRKTLAAKLAQVKSFDLYTHAAAQGNGTGEINLGSLPEGTYWVFPALSVLVTSAFAATADAHIGFRAYLKPDGTTQAEDDNAFFDNEDAATGGTFNGTLPPVLIDSAEPVKIYAMIDTGNIETNDTLRLHLASVYAT